MIDLNVICSEGSEESEEDICLDPELWHAYAGILDKMPEVDSNVIYFPQGHAENAYANINLVALGIPSCIPCRVSAINYRAHAETEELYAKLDLIPLAHSDFSHLDDGGSCSADGHEKPRWFSKILTPSDANNKGGFSVPVKCAEAMFPKLDYSLKNPVQKLVTTDVHGQVWKFKHIYRGNPKRHLFNKPWNDFVTSKKLMANDSVVFVKRENGELFIGTRKAKKSIEYEMGWNAIGANCESPFQSYQDTTTTSYGYDVELKGRERAERVIKAAKLAESGQRFEVVYYPRASMPQFCVKASAVVRALRVPWCAGVRFKMAFATEDSSQITWRMGSVYSTQVAVPVCWPHSPWRLLQVQWDRPELLHIKTVSPWLVELESDFFSHVNQTPVPQFSCNSLRYDSLRFFPPENILASLQGARQSPLALLMLLLGPPTFLKLFGELIRIPTTQESRHITNSSNENIEKPVASSVNSRSVICHNGLLKSSSDDVPECSSRSKPVTSSVNSRPVIHQRAQLKIRWDDEPECSSRSKPVTSSFNSRPVIYQRPQPKSRWDDEPECSRRSKPVTSSVNSGPVIYQRPQLKRRWDDEPECSRRSKPVTSSFNSRPVIYQRPQLKSRWDDEPECSRRSKPVTSSFNSRPVIYQRPQLKRRWDDEPECSRRSKPVTSSFNSRPVIYQRPQLKRRWDDEPECSRRSKKNP